MNANIRTGLDDMEDWVEEDGETDGGFMGQTWGKNQPDFSRYAPGIPCVE